MGLFSQLLANSGKMNAATAAGAGGILSSAVTGAVLGGVGAGLYKAAGGDTDIGKGAMMGALGFAAFKGLRVGANPAKLTKQASKLDPAKKLAGKKGFGHFANSQFVSFDEMGNRFSNWVLGSENYQKMIGKAGKTGAQINPWLRRGLRGVPGGAIMGSLGGAMYGGFSDKESMFGGAFKGALMGAAAGMVMRNTYGGFSRFTKAYRKQTGFADRVQNMAKRRADIIKRTSPMSTKQPGITNIVRSQNSNFSKFPATSNYKKPMESAWQGPLEEWEYAGKEMLTKLRRGSLEPIQGPKTVQEASKPLLDRIRSPFSRQDMIYL